MRSRTPARVLSALLALVALCGCAGGPPTVAPSGVDGLEIPTPSPDPRDFVARVDNPWLPLPPGAVWTYRTYGDAGLRTDVVTVEDRTRVVQGVPATVVHDRASDPRGRAVADTVDWYAQDAAGNVWHLGEATTTDAHGPAHGPGSWRAGVGGAEAGLAMPATPRVGDGYAQGRLAGVAEDRARVLSLDERRGVPAGTYDDLVAIEVTSPLEPGLVERRYYARGVGPVLTETVSGGTGLRELVDRGR